MTDVSPELSAWIAANRCSYEIAPIVELQDGDHAEVGFELNLQAELPWEGESTPELRAKAEEIRQKLGELVEVLVLKKPEKARIEVVPFRAALRFLGGRGRPKLTRTVRIFHNDYRNLAPEDRARFGPLEERLRSLGFKRT